MSWLSDLGSSGLADLIRSEPWIHTGIETVHIAGVILVLGSVLALDARLLGAGRRLPVRRVARFLIPISLVGLGVTILAGIGLFVVMPSAYAADPAFRIKLGLLVLALVNAVILRRSALRFDETTMMLGIGAGISLALWTAILFSGRLVALVS